MPDPGPAYRRTETGREAVASGDLAVPADYRRILRLIDSDTQFDVIRGALRRFPDRLIEDWLAELVEIGFLEAVPGGAELDLDFTQFFTQAAATRLTAEDTQRIAVEAKSAEATLARNGAWIAEDRLSNRRPASKPAADTTVLIVEDDPDQLALADLRVAMAGYRVRVARDGRELFDDLRTQSRPDIMLLDVLLPVGNGFEILARLRKHPKFALLPVVMLTAKDEPQEIERGLALGADAYVTKPYSKNIIVETIARILKMP